MITLGIDIGSEFVKAVILNRHKILSTIVTKSSDEAEIVTRKVVDEVLKNASLKREDIDDLAVTGAGKRDISFVEKKYSEVICQARGVTEIFPHARTILAMGAHGSMVLKLDKNGKVMNFITSDKCAGGAGSFLSSLARVLYTPLDDFDGLRDTSRQKIEMSNFCAVFAESEVISLIHSKIPKEDIIAGIIGAVSERLLALLKRVRVEEDLVLTGGVAKIKGLIGLFRERLNIPVFVPDDPMIGGALGAALLAEEKR